jgi:hypothetical protein
MPKELVARLWLRLNGPKAKPPTAAKTLPSDLFGHAAKTDLLLACGRTKTRRKKAFEETRKLAFAMDRELPVAKRLEVPAGP